jgi:hypothetical protein
VIECTFYRWVSPFSYCFAGAEARLQIAVKRSPDPFRDLDLQGDSPTAAPIVASECNHV